MRAEPAAACWASVNTKATLPYNLQSMRNDLCFIYESGLSENNALGHTVTVRNFNL